jgi:hypothetical protein
MKLKSLIRWVVALFMVALVAGCMPPYSGPFTSYVNPLTGLCCQPTPPKPSEIASANNNPNSFARANPGYDFTSPSTWTYVSGVQISDFPDGTKPPATTPPAPVSPAGRPGVGAAGAAATTGPMISSPPPPPPPTPTPSPRIY